MPRRGLTLVASIGASLGFVAVLVGKWDELEAGITGAAASVIAWPWALQVVALVSRSEAWRVCVQCVRWDRQPAEALPGLEHRLRRQPAQPPARHGGAHRGPAALGARGDLPRPALIAAELPILFVEAALAALTSFTLVGPLGLPWWTPIVCLVAVGSVGLRSGASRRRRRAGSRRARAALAAAAPGSWAWS